MDDLAQDTDPVATVTWTPPLYPDTVDMTTGRDMLAEIAQMQTELQVKCTELANLEDERDVTVQLLQAARESRRRLVCLLNAIDEELPRGEPWYSNMADRAVLVKDQLRYLRGL